MKKLLILILLLGTQADALTNALGRTQEELETIIGRPMTTNEITFIEYAVATRVTARNVAEPFYDLVFHVWLEINDSHYATAKIPKAMAEARWNLILEDDVYLKDITLNHIELDGPRCIISICANDYDGGLMYHMTADAVAVWASGILPFGYNADDFLNMIEKKAIEISNN